MKWNVENFGQFDPAEDDIEFTLPGGGRGYLGFSGTEPDIREDWSWAFWRHLDLGQEVTLHRVVEKSAFVPEASLPGLPFDDHLVEDTRPGKWFDLLGPEQGGETLIGHVLFHEPSGKVSWFNLGSGPYFVLPVTIRRRADNVSPITGHQRCIEDLLPE